MSMPTSLLLRNIARLEGELASCRMPRPTTVNANAIPSKANTNTVLHIPADAAEALQDLKAEIVKSSCKDNRTINEKLSFLTVKIGGKRHTRKSKKSKKSKKTRKH